MTDKIINPFEKKTNWSQKNEERIQKANTPSIKKSDTNNNINTNKKITRVAKSFKIFPGKLTRDFDKRVNKLQVHFDDLDYDKNYVDSGKYLMFLMAFAEKYQLYDLFCETDGDGNINLDDKKVKNHFGKSF